jgi:DNA invertase Pin-like site-specific DNA recombinase
MTTIGYARVSTDGQTLDAQQAALRLAGAEKVYSEKISGAVTDTRSLSKVRSLRRKSSAASLCVSIASIGRSRIV